MRRTAKLILASFLVGALSLGAAWAGSVLVPLDASRPDASAPARAEQGREAEQGEELSSVSTQQLEEGQILAGAAKVSMEPQPEAFGGTWETSMEKCRTLSENPNGITEGMTHVIDTRVRWHENPNCIYMGGYGLGPMNPITNWEDPYGLWIRAVAIGDGQDTVVLALLDGAYYEGKFNSMCNGAPFSAEQDCGFFDLRKALSEELGIAESGIFLSFTHSHTAPEFIGAWGGVPKWYMQQVEDSIKASVRAAVESMRPATLEIGETYARQFSSERRDHYRSAEDANLAWFRAVETSTGSDSETASPEPLHPGCEHGNTPLCPSPSPTPEEPEPGAAIFTVGAFAAHPVTEDTESGTADADFPAVFSHAVEERWGGVGILFQTGLGNISPRDGGHHEGELGKEKIGFGLASLMPEIGDGRRVDNPDVRSAQRWWEQPVTNSVLAGGGLAGIFDRSFNEKPAAINVGRSSSPNKKCSSASPVSVETVVNAAKIGPLWITGGPGELFSNLTNTIKEKNPTGVTLPLGITNDGLGYIMQSFESDHLGRQGVGFVGGPLAEYEDAYSIDHCIGDATLEYTLQLLGGL